ncbi:universal stress protein [Brucellaceae bacterium C25G]
MSYKTVIAYFRSETELPRILSATNLVAEKNPGVHIIGLYSIPAAAVYADINGFIDPGMFELHEKYHIEKAAKLKTHFETTMRNSTNSYEFQIIKSDTGTGAQGATQIACGADLIITGQTDIDDPDIANDAVDTLIFDSGRPVIMVPIADTQEAKALNRIAIAYNGKREGSRAALDALPLLKTADMVELLWIDPPVDDQGQAIVPQARELAKALNRHGIAINIQTLTSTGQSTIDVLQEYIQATNTDLLVMGAYSHSRLRELVFGGMTKSVFSNMPALTLFSR